MRAGKFSLAIFDDVVSDDWVSEEKVVVIDWFSIINSLIDYLFTHFCRCILMS